MSRRKSEATFGMLPFKIDDETDPTVTALAGLPLALEVWGVLGVAKDIKRLVKVNKRQGKITAEEWIEQLAMLQLCGGRTLEDLEMFKNDAGIKRIWPLAGKGTPRAALDFLKLFGPPESERPKVKQGTATIREETKGMKQLAKVRTRAVDKIADEEKPDKATLDHDATLIHCTKKEALYTYKKEPGYQPVTVIWSELDVVVADQFRDGNVPAGMGNLPIIKEAVKVVEKHVKEIYFRADTAAYEHEVINYLQTRKEGKIGFAISADMSVELQAEAKGVPEEEWKKIHVRLSDGSLMPTEKEYAEVGFVPTDAVKYGYDPIRYILIRVPVQTDLFEETERKYFAVASNLEWDAEPIIRWHRKKAGTIERTNDYVKNDLSQSHQPSNDFYANAAWYRISTLVYTLLAAVRILALGNDEFKRARPSTLTQAVFRTAGKFTYHSGGIVLKLSSGAAHLIEILKNARERLWSYSRGEGFKLRTPQPGGT